MEYCERLAVEIFQQHGLDFNTAERAGGWTNAVWLNGDFILRLSLCKGNDIIRREVERSKFLPSTVGYPTNIAVGIIDDYEWSLSKRITGKVLSEVWHKLSWNEKIAALKQIINIMDDVHSVDVSKIEHLTLSSAWYNPFIKEDSLSEIEQYIALRIFTPEQGRILIDIVKKFYMINACVDSVLCHGDITTDNLLWHDGNVVSLLDFEHSVIAPRQLDVHSIVNLALIPYDEMSSKDVVLLIDESQEIKQYVDEVIALLKPYLFKQSEKELFMGYNVLFRQRFLEFWLDDPKGDISECDAYQKLLSFCDGNNGYLAKLLNE